MFNQESGFRFSTRAVAQSHTLHFGSIGGSSHRRAEHMRVNSGFIF